MSVFLVYVSAGAKEVRKDYQISTIPGHTPEKPLSRCYNVGFFKHVLLETEVSEAISSGKI